MWPESVCKLKRKNDSACLKLPQSLWERLVGVETLSDSPGEGSSCCRDCNYIVSFFQRQRRAALSPRCVCREKCNDYVSVRSLLSARGFPVGMQVAASPDSESCLMIVFAVRTTSSTTGSYTQSNKAKCLLIYMESWWGLKVQSSV